MRPIVFATDGSPSAAEARQEAFELAGLTGAPLLAVSVEHTSLPPIGYAPYGYPDIAVELRRIEHERAASAVAEVAAAAAAAGLACETVKPIGVTVDEICRIARERDAQMIVIGSHGWGAAHRLFFGSVSEGVLHAAPCPVLVVRGADAVEEHATAA
jgi:nucleotide-binding universal stress UspA family protein